MGCPRLLGFDNDPGFVGSWQTDGYPYQPDVERSIRTLKHEVLWRKRDLEAGTILDAYWPFFNHDRMNQSDICADRPPYQAFPKLPILPRLADTLRQASF